METKTRSAAADAPQAAAYVEGGANKIKVVMAKDVEMARIVASPRRVYEMSVDGVDADLYIDDKRVELGVWVGVGYRLVVAVAFDQREASVYFDTWEDGLRYYSGVKDGGEIKTPDGAVIRVTWL